MLLVVIILGVLPGLIVGTVFALIPWLALRRRLQRPARLVWTSVGAWILAFAVPLVILVGRGVGAAVYGGAGIGVIDLGGPVYAFKVVAVFLAPPRTDCASLTPLTRPHVHFGLSVVRMAADRSRGKGMTRNPV